MLRVQKVGQWANHKRQTVDSRSVYPLKLGSYISPLIPIIIPMGLSSYGQFVSNTSYITNPGIALNFTSSSASGMSLPLPNTIKIGNSGDYLVIATINFRHFSGGGPASPASVRQWINLNGNDVPLSTVESIIDNNTTSELAITSQWMLTGVSANDALQVWYATDDVNCVPTQEPAIVGPTPSWIVSSPAAPAASVVVLQLST